MKPIIINMNEMSDSREVYDSRPNRALPVFLYTCLALFVVAIVWMCLGKIDIAVKANGMLRPDEAVNTVVNSVGGKVLQSEVEDGASVEAGDLLYVIEHEELLTQKAFYEEQKEYYEKQYAGLTTYLASVKEETNCFTDTDSEYAVRYQSFQIQLDTLRLELQTDAEAREYSKGYLDEKLAYYEEELALTEQLLESVQNGKSGFSSREDNPYATRYQMYLSDYKILEQQYTDKQREIERSTRAESLVNSEEYYTGVKNGLEKLIGAIEEDESSFGKEDNSLYATQYIIYESKRSELLQSYERADETYQINLELEEIAVSEWEVEESRLAKEQAYATYENYKTSTLSELKRQLEEVQINLDEVLLNKSASVEKEILLKQNEEAKENALSQYHLKYVVELQNAVTSLKENISALEKQLAEADYTGDKVLVYESEEKSEYAGVRKYKNDEMVAVQQSISSCEASLDEVKTQLTGIDRSIEDCYVKAPCSGTVNVIREPIVGNIVAPGTEMLSILPAEGTGYKCIIYVENADVGGLEPGMPVKFNVYSYPNAKYGYVYGALTKVAKDIRVDSASGMAYYQAEATVDVGSFTDASGAPISLKAGMACEAKIITEEKQILSFVLEKLNLFMTE